MKIYDDEYGYIFHILFYEETSMGLRKVKNLVSRYFNFVLDKKAMDLLMEVDGITYFNSTCKSIIILINNNKYKKVNSIEKLGTIGHECFHAATRALEYSRIKLNSKNQEIYARYYEWLFKSVLVGILNI